MKALSNKKLSEFSHAERETLKQLQQRKDWKAVGDHYELPLASEDERRRVTNLVAALLREDISRKIEPVFKPHKSEETAIFTKLVHNRVPFRAIAEAPVLKLSAKEVELIGVSLKYELGK